MPRQPETLIVDYSKMTNRRSSLKELATERKFDSAIDYSISPNPCWEIYLLFNFHFFVYPPTRRKNNYRILCCWNKYLIILRWRTEQTSCCPSKLCFQTGGRKPLWSYSRINFFFSFWGVVGMRDSYLWDVGPAATEQNTITMTKVPCSVLRWQQAELQI